MQPKQWEGRVIDGRFHLRQYLGGSGHSAVFLTESGEETPRKAAIKLVPANTGAADAWVLRREFAARLSHPGLLAILQFGTCRIDGAGFAYAVMESSDEDLSQVLPTRPLTPAEAREMLLSVAETLAYVHAQGFVHGRLTPANVMAAGDRVKISSDGLLRIGESSANLWEPHASDPPEGRSGVTPATDVWWLGTLAVEALTQRAPAWDPAAAYDPVVPETLAAPFRDIARRCLQRDPRSRCSMADVSRALQPDRPEPARPPLAAAATAAAKPAAQPAAKPPKYALWLMGAVLAGVMMAALLLAGIHLVSSFRSSEPPTPAPPAPAAVGGKPAAAPASGETAATPAPVSAPVPAAPVPAAPAPAPVSARVPTAPVPAAPAPAPVSARVPTAPVPAAPAPAPVSARVPTTPVPAAPAPAPAAAAPRPRVASAGPAGDVLERYTPPVPADYLATIHGVVDVSVRVAVDPSGAVVDAQLDSRSGGRYFDRVSLEAARRWKFQPAAAAAPGSPRTRLLRFIYRRDGCSASADEARR